MTEPRYAELHCHSYFSLLDGASSPEALVAQARRWGCTRWRSPTTTAWPGPCASRAAKRRAARALRRRGDAGAAHARDLPPQHLTLLAETQAGLRQPLPAAHRRRGSTACSLPRPPARSTTSAPPRPSRLARQGDAAADLGAAGAAHAGPDCAQRLPRGPLAAPLRPPAQRAGRRPPPAACSTSSGRDHLFVELQHHGPPRRRPARAPPAQPGATRWACRWWPPTMSITPRRTDARLRDALLAIDANVTLTEARRQGLLRRHRSLALAGAAEMAQRFCTCCREALANTLRIAERCQVIARLLAAPPAPVSPS